MVLAKTHYFQQAFHTLRPKILFLHLRLFSAFVTIASVYKYIFTLYIFTHCLTYLMIITKFDILKLTLNLRLNMIYLFLSVSVYSVQRGP